MAEKIDGRTERSGTAVGVEEIPGLSAILGDNDANVLLRVYLYSRPNQEASEAQVRAVFAWAEDAKMQMSFLENVLAGDMFIHLDDPNDAPSFSLTPKGEQRVEELIAQGALVSPTGRISDPGSNEGGKGG